MSTSLGWEGLASHWPYITDSSGLPTYGLNGPCQRDEHPPMLLLGYTTPLSLP